MDDVKRWAKERLTPAEFNKTWRPCHEYWEKRHQVFVQSKLKGPALAVYSNMDVQLKAAYNKLYGHQKTNFVVRYIVGKLFFNAEEDKRLLKRKFLKSKCIC